LKEDQKTQNIPHKHTPEKEKKKQIVSNYIGQSVGQSKKQQMTQLRIIYDTGRISYNL
jgi:uncharacterized Fe-S cluster-containing radical SAM superfamily enzyme